MESFVVRFDVREVRGAPRAWRSGTLLAAAALMLAAMLSLILAVLAILT